MDFTLSDLSTPATTSAPTPTTSSGSYGGDSTPVSNAEAGPSRAGGLAQALSASIDLTADSDNEDEDGAGARLIDRNLKMGDRAAVPLPLGSTLAHARATNFPSTTTTTITDTQQPQRPQPQLPTSSSSHTSHPYPLSPPTPYSLTPHRSMNGNGNGNGSGNGDGAGGPADDVQFTGSKIHPPSFGVPPSTFAPYAARGFPSMSSGAVGPSAALVPPTGGSWANGVAYPLPVNVNGVSYPSDAGPSAGASASSAIDLTTMRIPTPPPDNKKPVCIGSLISRVIMLYPAPAAVIGAQPPEGCKEKFDVVQHRGAEFLRVKLKYRSKGSNLRKEEPWTTVQNDVVQVLTPGQTTYLGDLDPSMQQILMPHMARGLLRLEGFVQRLQPEAPQFELKINILLFTLPSNINYISQSLLVNTQYLLDPIPPYDPSRHADRPPYLNAHGGQEQALRMMQLARAKQYGSVSYGAMMGQLGMVQMDKIKQVEVQRKQVEEVFKSLDNGQELEQSDPGPLIKTELFPHQRKALTFLLQREQDHSALKKARKYTEKRVRKALKSSKAASVDGDGEKDIEGGKDKEDTKGKSRDYGRSLWEGEVDDKGRVRSWKNRITAETRRAKKGESPNDGKGAILADDMGLGKTLSVVSLIAATRQSAKKWSKSKIDSETASEVDDAPGGSSVKVTEFKNRVFGMPSVDSDDESTTKGKKRKRDVDDQRAASLRQSRIYIRSKATLLVCPMSTITNWEDQIKEHWNGRVEIVGGAAGVMPSKVPEKKWKPPKKNGELSSDDDDDFDVLKVYIYHGSSRRADPDFIADFDIVVTSYNTLAQEFSKMNVSAGDDTGTTTPGDTAGNSDEDGIAINGDTGFDSRPVQPEVEAEIKANEVAEALRKSQKKKAKGVPVRQEVVSPLQAIDWFRVVLDEAHYIKSASTVASKASCYLAADRRIALTGTPIQNKIEDIWALFKFLRLDPVDRKEVFNEHIWNPCKLGDTVGVAKLQLVMRCCTLRRTKDSTSEDGRRILNLPPRREMQLWLDLREDERKAYDDRASAVKERVGELQAQGQLSKNYANVLQEVLRLRQICDHVDLAKSGAVEEDYDGTIMDFEVAVKGIETNGLNLARAQSVLSFLKDGDGASCGICTYDYSEHFPSMGLGGVEEGIKVDADKAKTKKMPHKPILTKCLHLFCPKCFRDSVYSDWLKRKKDSAGRQCSQCETSLRIPTDVIEVVPPGSPEAAELAEQAPKKYVRRKYVRPPGEKPNLSTKMAYLQRELLEASKRNPNSVHYDSMAAIGEIEDVDADGRPFVTKSVVFSQWTTMLDRIGDMLDEINIKYARLDGTMTREERAKACDALRHNKKVEVLLVSTRAGGVGLNLTAACRCFLVDPYWNPSVEAQAIDRIHRMGQTRPVTAIKLMINNSIELKLDEIQRKKANLAQLSLKNMTRKELMAQKAEELASLFR